MFEMKTVTTTAGDAVVTRNEAGIEVDLHAINPSIAHESFRGFKQALETHFDDGTVRPFFQDDGELCCRISIIHENGKEIAPVAAEVIGQEIDRVVARRAMREIHAQNQRIKPGISFP